MKTAQLSVAKLSCLGRCLNCSKVAFLQSEEGDKRTRTERHKWTVGLQAAGLPIPGWGAAQETLNWLGVQQPPLILHDISTWVHLETLLRHESWPEVGEGLHLERACEWVPADFHCGTGICTRALGYFYS